MEKTEVKKMQKQTIAMAIMVILLVVAISYIAVGKYQENKVQEQVAIYQQGAQVGYEQAITQLVQQAATCQQVPVTVQDQTLNLVAVECFQQAAGAGQGAAAGAGQ